MKLCLFNFGKKYILWIPIYYFTIQGVWSSIVIVHEKSVVFFVSFFRNISKTAETILIKKIWRNHGILVYKKALITNTEKIIFFEIITVLSKYLLVSYLVSLCVTNFCRRASSKTSVNIKTKFHRWFWFIAIKS